MFLRRPERVAAAVTAAFFVLPHAAFASSDPNFFNLSNSWNERFDYIGEQAAEPEPGKGFLADPSTTLQTKPSLKRGAASKYFVKEEEIQPDAVYIPPPIDTDFRALKRLETRNVELYENQVVTLQNARDIQRYLAVDPGIIEFAAVNPGELQIKGVSPGTTFVHLWDAEGRSTFRIQVTRAQRPIAATTRKYIETLESGEPFKLGYAVNRSAFYDGNGFETLGRTSFSLDQTITTAADTPYGHWDSITVLRDIPNGSVAEYAEARGSLTDARIGDFEHFDVHMGDTRVENGTLLAIPTMRLRGANLVYEDPKGRSEYSVFYGRELPSIIGSTAQSSGLKSVDSFVGGGVYEHKLHENARWKLGYASAYGQARPDILNRQAMEFVQTYNVHPTTVVEVDAAHDDEHTAHVTTATTTLKTARFRSAYRDISNEFVTIIGNPAQQGEQGLRGDIAWRPTDRTEVEYWIDAFRDRLFPFPGEEDRFNLDQEARLQHYFAPNSHARLEFTDRQETARLLPIRDRMWGVGYTHGFELYGRHFNVFGLLQDRDLENLTNPELNFRNDRLTTGIQLPLIWDMSISAQQEFNYLEETVNRVITHPRVYTYALNYNKAVGNTPFATSLSLRYRDEEEAGSGRSFLSGEDRFDAFGRLTYRIENMEFYLDGRFSSIESEDLTREPTRTEAEITSGMRYIFDTGYHWQASGSFEGWVFNDINNDGVRQPEEAGLPNLKVSVNSVDVLTDADGHWTSGTVSGKRAIIQLDQSGIPAGFVPSTPVTKEALIKQGAKQTISFGLSARSSVLGFVFQDLNGDERLGPGDETLSGVEIILDGSVRRRTDVRGGYRFADASVGSHRVEISFSSLPIGYLPRVPFAQDIQISEGLAYQVDFVIVAERKVSGRLFVDADGDSEFDAGEAGAPAGLRVRLGDQATETEAEGYYLFDAIPPGTYELFVEVREGYLSLHKETLVFGRNPQNKRIDIPISRAE